MLAPTTAPTPAPALGASDSAVPRDLRSPAERYQELFVDVQLGAVFADSKTFVDCVPHEAPERVLAAYREARAQPGFDLRAFVYHHFAVPEVQESHYVADPRRGLAEHIDQLWPVLTREPREHPPFSTHLPLKQAYVVPGGRFAELYYWDSYFTMLGFRAAGRLDLLHAMANNFAHLIDTYGHVPNGTRTYYLSRSQPPVFALMVDLFVEHADLDGTVYLPQLRKEYTYWMCGAERLQAGEAHRRVVRLEDGSLLNRYWDDRAVPRDEAYREDVETAARQTRRPAEAVYRDLRAAAESGWDFSSRWLDDPDELASIRTTELLPVDLNSFLYALECTIAELALRTQDMALHRQFHAAAIARRQALQRCWSADQAAFFDYDWVRGRLSDRLCASTVTPLFVGCAHGNQADALAHTLERRLLAPGGLATSEYRSGQQWDARNGWAPLQWLAVRGLAGYGQERLADEIGRRWLDAVGSVYRRHGKLIEKYDVHHDPSDGDDGLGCGGEYPLQDGFGWTNGVTRRLIEHYPGHMSCALHTASASA